MDDPDVSSVVKGPSQLMAKVMIIGALPESLVNFRGELIKEIAKGGHEVLAMAGPAIEDTIRNIESLGATFISYPVQRAGMNPKKDIKTLWALYNLIKYHKPDAIIAYTIKPVIWGGIAARLLGVSHHFHGLITGLGFTFQGDSNKQKVLNNLVSRLYKVSLKSPAKVIFQNQDNQKEMIDRKIVMPSQSFVVNGSGVDLDHFKEEPMPEGKPLIFLTIARLLGAKGLREYAEAAKSVKKLYPDTQFKLLGPEDPSPDRISIEEVKEWHRLGFIDYCGSSDDVRPWLKACHVYVLNSYHEGMPRTVLEAMSTGRPIITTQVSGCRETVSNGINGYLIPKADTNALINAMIQMIKNKEKLKEMGQESLKIAKQKFDVHQVNRHVMNIMSLT